MTKQPNRLHTPSARAAAAPALSEPSGDATALVSSDLPSDLSAAPLSLESRWNALLNDLLADGAGASGEDARFADLLPRAAKRKAADEDEDAEEEEEEEAGDGDESLDDEEEEEEDGDEDEDEDDEDEDEDEEDEDFDDPDEEDDDFDDDDDDDEDFDDDE